MTIIQMMPTIRWGNGRAKEVTIDYFFERTYMDPNSGCWLWLGDLRSSGHAACHCGGHASGHRLSYSVFKGEIPAGHDLHHICANPSCVNPDHVVPLTHSEHPRIDNARYERFRNKPFCKQGHPRTPDNLYVITVASTGKKYRQCIQCRRESALRQSEKRRQRVKSEQRSADATEALRRAVGE